MTADLRFMEAVRGALVPALAGLVEPASIRVGGVRPEAFPAVVLSIPRTSISGYASGRQIVAELDTMLHIWTRDDDAETAQRIGAAVMRAMMDAPAAVGLAFDGWERPVMSWVADPVREALHGAVALSAVVRWRE